MWKECQLCAVSVRAAQLTFKRVVVLLLISSLSLGHLSQCNVNSESSDSSPHNKAPKSGLIHARDILVRDLNNNDPHQLNIAPGETQLWRLPKSVILGTLSPTPTGLPSDISAKSVARPDLRKRGENQVKTEDETLDTRGTIRQTVRARKIYVSATICLQPSTNLTRVDQTRPQLQISGGIRDPRNQQADPTTQSVNIQEGYGKLEQDAVAGDYFIQVVAPQSPAIQGQWSYEIAASIDAFFHTYDYADPFLHLIDSDSTSALLITDNLTLSEPTDSIYQQWVKLTPPFEMFAVNASKSTVDGLFGSFCGLKNAPLKASAQGNDEVFKEASITVRGLGSKPKQQFHLKGLQPNSDYRGVMVMNGNSTQSGRGVIGGGGRVWKSIGFSTKTDGNCQVLFDLPFCNETAYAVPANPGSINYGSLASLYDEMARNLYLNFSMSLEQVACQTEREAQYSLVKTCDDCRKAYKQWICAVTIPRCDDYSSQKSFLMPRNAGQKFLNGSSSPADPDAINSRPWTNASRLQFIDDHIAPGPYKEILPCKDLCYALVQSCPAVLQFSCPNQDRGLLRSYGERNDRGDITCSFLGAAFALSGASHLGVSLTLLSLSAVVSQVFWL